MKSTTRQKKKKAVRGKNIFEMVCKSEPREISCIEEFLHQVQTKWNIDDGTMYRLLVSCTEAVNNAILHGNKSDSKKRVFVKCTIWKKMITISVKDEGSGFNPEKLQDPREEKNLLKENGRGVFLMQALMDKVRFRRLKSGSVVDMQVKLR